MDIAHVSGLSIEISKLCDKRNVDDVVVATLGVMLMAVLSLPQADKVKQVKAVVRSLLSTINQDIKLAKTNDEALSGQIDALCYGENYASVFLSVGVLLDTMYKSVGDDKGVIVAALEEIVEAFRSGEGITTAFDPTQH